jgi:hypothetical protein
MSSWSIWSSTRPSETVVARSAGVSVLACPRTLSLPLPLGEQVIEHRFQDAQAVPDASG